MPINARPIVELAVMAMLSFLIATPVHAQTGRSPDPLYCGERELGRYFYCDSQRQRQDEAPEPEVTVGVSSKPSAREEVAEIRETLEELRAEAVLRPTSDSVAAYISYQREQLDRASHFSDVWRRVLWQKPDLDYTLVRPVSQMGKRNWLDARADDREQVLATLHERYGLFYFYAASCTACTEFSPVLADFAQKHQLSVKAVSTDGGANPHFASAVPDQGQMARLGLAGSPTPAVVLFDTETKAVMPVSFGIVAQSELADRIFVLTQTRPGEDY